MILPNNGKIVIIDDMQDEVEKLMMALAREKMPFLFFTDPGESDLPNEENGPIKNVRLVFLDLDLGLGDGSDKVQKIRIVQNRLKRIIEPKTPYVLVIWSSYEDSLLPILLDDFNDHFSDYKPIVDCSLDKQNTLGEANVVETIRAKLKEQLVPFQAFNAFLLWESIVNSSAGQVTNDIVSIFKKDANWDKNIKNTFYEIAKAELGSELIETIDDKERLKLAVKIINSSLIDCVENNIDNQFDTLSIKDIKQGGQGLRENAITKLNTNIHIIKATDLKHFSAGNLYIRDISESQRGKLKDFFKEGKLEEVTTSNPKHIQLDITPACDYSNPKQFTRIIEGILFDGSFGKSALQSFNYIYKECPVIEIDSPLFMIFDFRSLTSYSEQEFKKEFTEKPQVRLRSNLLLDIQAQLSNHINRPGIFSLK